MGTWPLFEVTVDGFGSSVLAARSRGAALYSRYLDFTDAYECSFRRWLELATARKVSAAALPADDPYAYMRRYYERDLRHGTRVKIQHEGPDLNGRLGTVVHPGRGTTAYAHVVLDGTKYAVNVHPLSVEIVSQPAPTTAPTDEVPF